MFSFKLRGWNAFAAGLDTPDLWSTWLDDPKFTSKEVNKAAMKHIPPMLRRRFSEMGKNAIGATSTLLAEGEHIPLVFASRHGDVDLTLSLLETIAKEEPLSPTGFSLAVHNAFTGLFSIARDDLSEVTAIAATDALIPCAILEAATQLQEHENVLCIICDSPLPELYQPFSYSAPFGYAVAMVLSRTEGETFYLENQPNSSEGASFDTELAELIRLLSHRSHLGSFANTELNSEWRITR